MKITTAIAASAVALLGSINSANADVMMSFPGSYVFSGTSGQTITTGALTGTLSGVRVVFTYQRNAGSSTAYDVAFTVNQHQWGGYLPFINNASIGECPTGAPDLSTPVTFASGNLGFNYNIPLNSQSVVVGFGNGNQGGGCTVSNITITLIGVVPAPGAGAALSLGGLCCVRRRRR
jgi:hypothetical protein